MPAILSSLFSAFVFLFVIIDPIGTAAVYAALTGEMPHEQARATARRAVLIAFTVLLLFGVFGAVLIKTLGISLGAFHVAGGLLLFVIAFRMLMGHHDLHSIENQSSVYGGAAARADVSVFPLAIPLLSGPGCMTAMILLTQKAPTTLDGVLVFVAMGLVLVCAYAAMLAAKKIITLFGPGGIQIIARLMGILLAALAIQFIADGTKSLWG